jgi:hypothetical protein
MKIIYSLPEYLRLVVSFNSETQLGMQAAEPVLEEFENILFHNQLPDWNGNEALASVLTLSSEEASDFAALPVPLSD